MVLNPFNWEIHIQEKIMDKAKSFIEQNWKWLLTSVLLIGVNLGIVKAQLAMKINEKEAREIAQEEIKDAIIHYYPDIKGMILETELKNIQKQLDRIEALVERR